MIRSRELFKLTEEEQNLDEEETDIGEGLCLGEVVWRDDESVSITQDQIDNEQQNRWTPTHCKQPAGHYKPTSEVKTMIDTLLKGHMPKDSTRLLGDVETNKLMWMIDEYRNQKADDVRQSCRDKDNNKIKRLPLFNANGDLVIVCDDKHDCELYTLDNLMFLIASVVTQQAIHGYMVLWNIIQNFHRGYYEGRLSKNLVDALLHAGLLLRLRMSIDKPGSSPITRAALSVLCCLLESDIEAEAKMKTLKMSPHGCIHSCPCKGMYLQDETVASRLKDYEMSCVDPVYALLHMNILERCLALLESGTLITHVLIMRLLRIISEHSPKAVEKIWNKHHLIKKLFKMLKDLASSVDKLNKDDIDIFTNLVDTLSTLSIDNHDKVKRVSNSLEASEAFDRILTSRYNADRTFLCIRLYFSCLLSCQDLVIRLQKAIQAILESGDDDVIMLGTNWLLFLSFENNEKNDIIAKEIEDAVASMSRGLLKMTEKTTCDSSRLIRISQLLRLCNVLHQKGSTVFFQNQADAILEIIRTSIHIKESWFSAFSAQSTISSDEVKRSSVTTNLIDRSSTGLAISAEMKFLTAILTFFSDLPVARSDMVASAWDQCISSLKMALTSSASKHYMSLFDRRRYPSPPAIPYSAEATYAVAVLRFMLIHNNNNNNNNNDNNNNNNDNDNDESTTARCVQLILKLCPWLHCSQTKEFQVLLKLLCATLGNMLENRFDSNEVVVVELESAYGKLVQNSSSVRTDCLTQTVDMYQHTLLRSGCHHRTQIAEKHGIDFHLRHGCQDHYLLPREWMFLPIRMMVNFPKQFKSLSNVVSTCELTLNFVRLLDRISSMEDDVESYEQYTMIASIFLLGHEVFLEENVYSALLSILKSKVTKWMVPITYGQLNQFTGSFGTLYKDLIEAYQADSFNDPLFALYLIIPALFGDFAIQELFWTERIAFTPAFVIVRDLIGPVNLQNVFKAQHVDYRLALLAYRRACNSTEAWKKSFAYILAVHYLNQFTYDQTVMEAGSMLQAQLEKNMSECQGSSINSVFLKHVKLFKSCHTGATVDDMMYKKLPEIRCRWLSTLKSRRN